MFYMPGIPETVYVIWVLLSLTSRFPVGIGGNITHFGSLQSFGIRSPFHAPPRQKLQNLPYFVNDAIASSESPFVHPSIDHRRADRIAEDVDGRALAIEKPVDRQNRTNAGGGQADGRQDDQIGSSSVYATFHRTLCPSRRFLPSTRTPVGWPRSPASAFRHPRCDTL